MLQICYVQQTVALQKIHCFAAMHCPTPADCDQPERVLTDVITLKHLPLVVHAEREKKFKNMKLSSVRFPHQAFSCFPVLKIIHTSKIKTGPTSSLYLHPTSLSFFLSLSISFCTSLSFSLYFLFYQSFFLSLSFLLYQSFSLFPFVMVSLSLYFCTSLSLYLSFLLYQSFFLSLSLSFSTSLSLSISRNHTFSLFPTQFCLLLHLSLSLSLSLSLFVSTLSFSLSPSLSFSFYIILSLSLFLTISQSHLLWSHSRLVLPLIPPLLFLLLSLSLMFLFHTKSLSFAVQHFQSFLPISYYHSKSILCQYLGTHTHPVIGFPLPLSSANLSL